MHNHQQDGERDARATRDFIAMYDDDALIKRPPRGKVHDFDLFNNQQVSEFTPRRNVYHLNLFDDKQNSDSPAG
jgi:hypothetical protein